MLRNKHTAYRVACTVPAARAAKPSGSSESRTRSNPRIVDLRFSLFGHKRPCGPASPVTPACRCDHHEYQCRWLRHGSPSARTKHGATSCTRRNTCVCPPSLVGRRRSIRFAPHDVISSIHHAIDVEVAGRHGDESRVGNCRQLVSALRPNRPGRSNSIDQTPLLRSSNRINTACLTDCHEISVRHWMYRIPPWGIH